MLLRLRLLFCLMLLACCSNVRASHIVGGEMTYRILSVKYDSTFIRSQLVYQTDTTYNADSSVRTIDTIGVTTVNIYSRDTTLQYRVSLDLYRDCLNGSPQAIQEDIPAIFSLFDGRGHRLRVDSIGQFTSFHVPVNFNNDCIKNAPPTCLERATIAITYIVHGTGNGGYTVVYQRCCRNASVINIRNPDATGATYFCDIPPITPPNNSAVFKNYPPQIICINNPLVYDASASDADGDSLSYELCEAYAGGSVMDVKPVPDDVNFQPVSYVGNFSASKPMAGFPLISINPVTGEMSGTPNVQGRFVVTICCHEWRRNSAGQPVMINTVRREFQFVVTDCSKAVVANIPQYSTEFNTYIVQCSSNTVHFDNLSTGGFAYHWDFGVEGTLTDTSSEFEPTFTYPDTGTYVVKLVVNQGTTCPDSITRYVKVYPIFKADYRFDGLQCPHSPMQFFDESSSTLYGANAYLWNFGDSVMATDKNPVHTFDTGGVYAVTLISSSQLGCIDTAVKDVEIENFRPFAANDTVIVKGERIDFRASGGIAYQWMPGTYLSNTNTYNPTGFYPDITSITYVVHITSSFGCQGNDTFTVKVVNQASLFIPTAFTPNGDGKNDIFRPRSVGYHTINYFRVYNRWGENVFYTTHFEEGWDGTNHGKPSDIGTYFWEVSENDRFGKAQKISGDVELIR